MSDRRRRAAGERGAILMVAIFLMLIALPIALVLLRQTQTHRKQAAQSQVRIRDYYLARSAAEEVVQRMRNGSTFSSSWHGTQQSGYEVYVDSQPVKITVIHEADLW